MNHYNSFPRSPKSAKPRVPLRSTQELAEEFGITAKQLGAIMGGFKNDPSVPVAIFSAKTSAKVSYFNPHEVRAWWNSLPPESKPTVK